jgi:hypothetical protein
MISRQSEAKRRGAQLAYIGNNNTHWGIFMIIIFYLLFEAAHLVYCFLGCLPSLQMGTFAEIANVDYRLSFADSRKQTSVFRV